MSTLAQPSFLVNQRLRQISAAQLDLRVLGVTGISASTFGLSANATRDLQVLPML